VKAGLAAMLLASGQNRTSIRRMIFKFISAQYYIAVAEKIDNDVTSSSE